MEYEDLKRAYLQAETVCDPLTYISRQRNLLRSIAEYLLQRDMTVEDKIDGDGKIF